MLKPASSTDVVAFLQFVSGIKDGLRSELDFKGVHPRFALVCTEETNGKLTLRAQSELQVLQELDTNKMESVGSCVLDLLQHDHKSGSVPGLLFIQCLQQLASQLCKSTGYASPSLSTSTHQTHLHQTPVAMADTRPTSSALLECEDLSHGLSHTQTYYNALVLYVAAALCEHMSNEVLQCIELPTLLKVVSTIICCHAHFVSSKRATSGGSQALLLTEVAEPNLDELPGGSITLSIVFGLLSAILGGGKEVKCTLATISTTCIHNA